MPYASNRDLPDAVKRLPSGAQSRFRAAFNAAYEKHHGDEKRAFAIAWAAAKGPRKKKEKA